MSLLYFRDNSSLVIAHHHRGGQDRASSRRIGFTLVEVLIGAVLLSSLIVMSLHGFRLHRDQLRFNEHRIEASVIAERLLTSWWNRLDGVPIGITGVVDLERQWFWRTAIVGTRPIFGQPTIVVRLEIIENHPQPNVVLVSVDFVQPAPSVAPAFIPDAPSAPEPPEPQPEEPAP